MPFAWLAWVQVLTISGTTILLLRPLSLPLMKLFFTDRFVLPLPPGHRFPMSKYRLLRDRLVCDPLHADDVFLEPPAATREELCLAHDPSYVDRVFSGQLGEGELKRIGFPWSEAMVERSRRSSGATLAAARAALSGERISVNLAGGTHHALRDAGEGYCVFNDAAVTIRTLLGEGRIARACVIDCDVHQGNGTICCLRDDESTYTFSMHQDSIYPIPKEVGDLDIELQSGCQDEQYNRILEENLNRIMSSFPADIVFIVGGCDTLSGDPLAGLEMTPEGIVTRDAMIVAACVDRKIPVVFTLAGGYSQDAWKTQYQSISHLIDTYGVAK